jgi:hypothetical protein
VSTANVQSAWRTLALVVDELEDKAEDRVKELLGRQSLSHKAVVDCLFAGYGAGAQVAQAGQSRAPEDVIEATLGLTSGIGLCAKSIREAEPERIVTLDTVAGKTRAAPWRAATSRSMTSFVKLGLPVLRAMPWPDPHADGPDPRTGRIRGARAVWSGCARRVGASGPWG